MTLRPAILGTSGATLLLVGCVERTLTVTSDPPGALVFLNEREAGRTPFTTDIGWYGTHDVVVRKEGFETITTTRRVLAPWWGYPPFDLVAELMPWRPRDEHTLAFRLTERPSDETPEALIARGMEMRGQLPTTRPARLEGVTP